MGLTGNPLYAATGGPVPGYGTRDTVPAMLTPGEYIINNRAVSRIGVEALDRVNFARGGSVPGRLGFAAGGSVPGGTSITFNNCSFTGEDVADRVEASLSRKFDNRQGAYQKRVRAVA